MPFELSTVSEMTLAMLMGGTWFRQVPKEKRVIFDLYNGIFSFDPGDRIGERNPILGSPYITLTSWIWPGDDDVTVSV